MEPRINIIVIPFGLQPRIKYQFRPLISQVNFPSDHRYLPRLRLPHLECLPNYLLLPHCVPVLHKGTKAFPIRPIRWHWSLFSIVPRAKAISTLNSSIYHLSIYLHSPLKGPLNIAIPVSFLFYLLFYLDYDF